ncbi:MAG: NAD(P)-dependent oxidoreductase [Actinomycetota bacterium]|nr:NAD(P)-dependent oxidoreductase [Actinomycetota bacterium]
MRTGFVGTGLMGAPMARTLLRDGFPLTVWNRTEKRASEVLSAGAKWAWSPSEVAGASEVVVTMVSDDAAVEETVLGPGGLVEGMAEGSVLVEMSTTSPAAMESLASRLRERGVALVDAPVFGSTEPAASGDLWTVVGAEAADLERVRPLLASMCQSVFHMGPPGAGSLMKVSGNLVVTGMLALLGESLSLGRAGGLDPRGMLAVLHEIDFSSPLYDGKGAQILDGDFRPRFPLKHALKDVRLADAVGQQLKVPLRGVEGFQHDFAAAVEAGHGEEDCAAVIKAVAEGWP